MGKKGVYIPKNISKLVLFAFYSKRGLQFNSSINLCLIIEKHLHFFCHLGLDSTKGKPSSLFN